VVGPVPCPNDGQSRCHNASSSQLPKQAKEECALRTIIALAAFDHQRPDPGEQHSVSGRFHWAGEYGMAVMAYDEELSYRIRELLADESGITEKKMFGGLAFLLHGNMTVSASRNGGLLVRIDPSRTDTALARHHTALMEMGGRTMGGWITISADGLKTKRELAAWVERALAFAKTLPPKPPPKGTRR
jgi:TfoX/Sxy family transcriptional regulator of competence genes